MLALRWAQIQQAARTTQEAFMESEKVLPITKWQARSKNDRKASKFYSKRLLIDQSTDERRVMRQLKEVWDE
jgi:hypothetical protein